ncbi:hypothetical protein GQ607_012241 [Colletotrichum asianum]|uniref:Uncharacterized protein n=1 Tax=Colletotrichum asianum TaxID=702518 RepID=A0A8H3ZQZ3_9PEZI|nr:hypothetical protein GQ607_012241 [Colletotrichum asianum]
MSAFLRPPGPGAAGDYTHNPVYSLGQEVELSWQKEYDVIDLILTQSSPERDPSVYLLNATSAGGYRWNVSLDDLAFPDWYDPKLSPVYFFRMLLAGTTGGGTTSHYFNITEAAVSATTTSSSAVTSPTASSTSASASTPATLKDEREGLSGGTIAGIAIGATLGTLAVGCLVGWMVWKQTRNRKQALAGQSEKSLHEVHGQSHVRYELGSSDQRDARHELPTDQNW